MHGPDATRIIRNFGFTNPIIGATGNTSAIDIQTFIAAGANDVLGKPISRDRLRDILATVAAKKESLIADEYKPTNQ